jgi:hypothetical protein
MHVADPILQCVVVDEARTHSYLIVRELLWDSVTVYGHQVQALSALNNRPAVLAIIAGTPSEVLIDIAILDEDARCSFATGKSNLVRSLCELGHRPDLMRTMEGFKELCLRSLTKIIANNKQPKILSELILHDYTRSGIGQALCCMTRI